MTDRLRGLGLKEWGTVVAILAGLATIAAVVVPLVSGEDAPAESGSCARATDWSDVDELEDGEVGTVRGPVVSSTYAPDSNARPTYLNIGRDYPEPDRFTVVIFGDDRGNFRTPPEDAYDGQEVAISGELGTFSNVRQIIANHPNDIAPC